MFSKDREILNDEQLAQEGKNKDHQRKQLIEDTKTYVTVGIIYGIPLAMCILAVLLFIHYIKSGDWEALEDILRYLVGGAGGVIIMSLLKAQNINKD